MWELQLPEALTSEIEIKEQMEPIFKGHRIHLRKRIFILESGKKFIIEFCRTVDEISEKVKEDLWKIIIPWFQGIGFKEEPNDYQP
ncbi:hypothetical protein [Leptospira santarosai]|nr:hypothetical protein [Leptospira santarosai]